MSPPNANPANFYLESYHLNKRKTRIFASGTLFQTHTFTIPTLPNNNESGTTVTRAHSVTKTLNGNAMGTLAILSHLNSLFSLGGTETFLLAPLGGSYEGRTIIEELEKDGIRTKYCKIIENSGVPGAWVFKAKGSTAKNVVLHNPLMDLTHEEFVSLLGPILIPENYPPPAPTNASSPPQPPPPNMAPFEWLHFECRSFKTTLSNLQGLDGLARDRGWRRKVTFSLDVSGSTSSEKQRGIQALLPHVDVVFFDKLYAQSLGYSAPRPFLLAMTPLVAPHALLVINWADSPHQTTPSGSFAGSVSDNEGGAALLSFPTREYLQSSSFTPPIPTTRLSPNDYNNVLDISISTQNPHSNAGAGPSPHPHLLRGSKVESVTSGSAFYADGHRSSLTASSSFGFLENFQSMDISHSTSRREAQSQFNTFSADVDDWDMYTVSHTPSIIDTRENDDHLGGREGVNFSMESEPQSMEDRQAEQSAFVGSMIYALTRKLLPGGLWSPVAAPTPGQAQGGSMRNQRSPIYSIQEDRKWGLDECLKFATELTGRRRYLSKHPHRHTGNSTRHRPHNTSIPDRRTLDKEVIEQLREAGWQC